ncbi:hypothetical protein CVT24_008499 [Panaeolus cyanescens]|uniref:BTB domain-containing protein n=1 Tax=Panaeolus cyanescens TaxID=181874 RepID=A0A409WCV8_9AGAR|nr:hypothetical protein CVT24_008499 [Panaeolus cyanescens]
MSAQQHVFPSSAIEPTEPFLMQAKDQRFWLTKNHLDRFSETFHSMFRSPHIGSPEEGTVGNPLFLDGIDPGDFEPLVRWLTFGANPPRDFPYTTGQLLGMLRLVDMWSMKEAKDFCYAGLATLNPDPFFHLRVMTSFRDWDRLRPHVIQAVKLPVNDWPLRQPPVYEPLMILAIRLSEVRRHAAAAPYHIPCHQSCTNHALCTSSWENDWRINITAQVFHPTLPLPLDQCYNVMVNVSLNANPCRMLALSEMQVDGDFDIEHDLVTAAVKGIEKNFNT